MSIIGLMYDYAKEKSRLFTDDGQVMFLQIRDRVRELLAVAGAVRVVEALMTSTGDSYLMLACLDRMVELGEIRLVQQPCVATQERVYVRGSLPR